MHFNCRGVGFSPPVWYEILGEGGSEQVIFHAYYVAGFNMITSKQIRIVYFHHVYIKTAFAKIFIYDKYRSYPPPHTHTTYNTQHTQTPSLFLSEE
jgi:hypothetical protein